MSNLKRSRVDYEESEVVNIIVNTNPRQHKNKRSDITSISEKTLQILMKSSLQKEIKNKVQDFETIVDSDLSDLFKYKSKEGDCNVCSKKSKVCDCPSCSHTTCAQCSRKCKKCEDIFCKLCCITNYDQPEEIDFCVDCHLAN